MTTLYEIVKSLQNASGSNAKSAILEQHKGNDLLKAFMKAVNDPAINYWQSKIPPFKTLVTSPSSEFGKEHIEILVGYLAERKDTGDKAKKTLGFLNHCLNDQGKELLSLIIKRSAGAGIGDTMILKAFPDLFFTVPYQRCSLMDSKIKEKFSKLPVMWVQPKLDGSFLYLVNEGAGKLPEAITRAGSKYPTWFAEKLAEGVLADSVLVGECLVWKGIGFGHYELLDRQTGNGILNSVLKGEDEEEFKNLKFEMTAWDTMRPVYFKKGLDFTEYKYRLGNLDIVLENSPPNVRKIQTYEVTSLEEAYKIYSEHTGRGEEGCVLKNPDSIWKDGTSKDNVKLKIQFEIELRVTGTYEGEGKYKGMLGGIAVETSDGLLKSNCGTGFSDAQRKNPPFVVGDIVTIKANDVISSRDSDIKSLFLPVYSDTRFDKTEADSLARVMEQLQAAKDGK